MTDKAAFRATYSDLRLVKGRKVLQLVFEVPLEESNSVLAILGGMPNPAAEVWCGIAKLKPETEVMRTESELRATNDTPPASGPDIQARARKPVDPDKRLAQRAAICCGDPLFLHFLIEKHGLETSVMTPAEFVRKFCNVASRADIKPNTESGLRWNLLESAFVAWRDVPEYADAQ